MQPRANFKARFKAPATGGESQRLIRADQTIYLKIGPPVEDLETSA